MSMSDTSLGSVHTGQPSIPPSHCRFQELTSTASSPHSKKCSPDMGFQGYRTATIGLNTAWRSFRDLWRPTNGIQHLTSSPRYPQSNDQAERTVQTVKRLSGSQRTFSGTAELPGYTIPLLLSQTFIGRRLRTTLPQTDDQLICTTGHLRKNRSQLRVVRSPPMEADSAETWEIPELDEML